MLSKFRPRLGSQLEFRPIYSILNSVSYQRFLNQTVRGMATESPSSKRPMCPSCSRPSRLCLCTRLRNPILDNSVGITILQHNLERNHPLNSTRIAKLGFKNLTLVPVSDLSLDARFIIRPFGSNCEMESVNSDDLGNRCSGDQYSKKIHHVDGSTSGNENILNLDLGRFSECTEKKGAGFDSISDPAGIHVPYITVTVAKYVGITALTLHGIPLTHCTKLNFEQLLTLPVVFDALRKGFVVEKFQRKQLNGSNECEECKEFEVTVPSGSVLLFPSERSIDVKAIDFKGKNLFVLDGTWAKAKRMYKENPWLKLLPHMKLDIDKPSLYSEVRNQPSAGCLSTIESIVYALKAMGENPDGLDDLLDVFESMVRDQRQCKDERLSKASLV